MSFKFELDDGQDETSELIESNTVFPDQIRQMAITDGADKEWASDFHNRRVLYGLDQATAEFIDKFATSTALQLYLEDQSCSLPKEISDTVYEFLNKRPPEFRKGKKKIRDIMEIRGDVGKNLGSGENMANA